MKVNFISILTALLLSAAAAHAAGADGSAAIDGRVVDATGASVPEAAVTLRRGSVGFQRTVRTDRTGRFAFHGLSEGVYLASASRPGFSVAAQDLTLGAGEHRALDFRLEPGTFAEQVTVVATHLAGSPEALGRIPGSVQVLDKHELDTSRVFNFSEALRKLPGLVVRDEEGFGLRPNVGVRGLNPTRSSKVLLLEDGVPVTYAPYGDNASYYHPPVERFETIEVMKGSAQVAYGPVTVGGVINYITPAPPLEPSGSLLLAGGSRAYGNGRVTVGDTIGRTGLLVDYMKKQGDGARANTHSDLDDLSLKSTTSLGGRHTVTLKANYYGEDSRVTYSGLRLDEYRADPRQNPFHNDFFYGDRYGASARHAWAIGHGMLLTTQAYGSHFRRHWWRQSSNSGQRPNDNADPACAGMANLDTTCGNEGRLRSYAHWGVEPRLRVGRRVFGHGLETDLGVRAHFEDQERRQVNGDTPLARSGRLVEDNERQNQAWSGFVQTRLLLGRWTVTPGVRLEQIRFERTNRLAAGGAVSGRTDLTQWVPGLGVAFAPLPDTTVFAGVHRGFAPPRTEDVVSNAGGTVDLDPELSWNYEAGLRSLPRPGVRLEATGFRMDYENQIVPASLAGGLGATLTNGGRTLHAGVEISARLDGGTLTGSRHNPYLGLAWAWLPVARFEGRRLSSVPGFAAVSVSGNRLPYAPEGTLNATLGYAHPSGFEALVEAVRVGGQFGDDLNSVDSSADGQRGLLPAYTVWNAAVNYRLPGRHATLFVALKNLTDRTFLVDRARGMVPGSPRLVHLGLRLTL
jgi:Fe(3+) dicitrate transport protein